MPVKSASYLSKDCVEAGVNVNCGGAGWCMAVNIAGLVPFRLGDLVVNRCRPPAPPPPGGLTFTG